jgi:rod shape determining protein RodA
MNKFESLSNPYEHRLRNKMSALRWNKLHLDPLLLFGLIAIAMIGMVILYSASNQSLHTIERDLVRLGLGFGIMLVFAQISPQKYQQWAPWIYAIGLLLLVLVLFIGKSDRGAQRWLSLGFFRFQPSEIMKLAMPMMLSWYMDDKTLPPAAGALMVCSVLLAIPVLLTAKQPDLGTAIIIAASGVFVILLAGISWRLIAGLTTLAALCTPILWHFMHAYQKERVMTFLNPESDPLGSGYHIIQSKIAIGSGGLFGKGWLNGTQAHLKFLPEHTTDFIFAVSAEEFGFIGAVLLILVFLGILSRCLYISSQAQSTFNRLLTGSLCLTFFISVFINIGMVAGILPVVGIPLPFISYGGTSLVSIMAGFGIIMSVHTHKKLLSS